MCFSSHSAANGVIASAVNFAPSPGSGAGQAARRPSMAPFRSVRSVPFVKVRRPSPSTSPSPTPGRRDGREKSRWPAAAQSVSRSIRRIRCCVSPIVISPWRRRGSRCSRPATMPQRPWYCAVEGAAGRRRRAGAAASSGWCRAPVGRSSWPRRRLDRLADGGRVGLGMHLRAQEQRRSCCSAPLAPAPAARPAGGGARRTCIDAIAR